MSDRDVTYLVTHSGAFHADEVCAYVVLSALFPEAKLVRTRDAELISRLEEQAIIFDVGEIYDPDTGRFDHHQQGRLVRPGCEVPYSSFGLIWKAFGETYLVRSLGLSSRIAGSVAEAIDREVVFTIDAIDNGVIAADHEAAMHGLALPSLIIDQRPDFDGRDPDAEDAAFLEAVELARRILEAKVRQAAAALRADEIVTKALRDREDPRWIELPMSMPCEATIHAAGARDVLFVVNPAGDEWQINTVPEVPGRYGARAYLPESWAGLREATLRETANVEDAVFCHAKRFIAITRTRQGALDLLGLALAEASDELGDHWDDADIME